MDRHLIDADLYWSLSEANEEIRMIDLSDETMDFLEDFAADYREDVVSRTEARRILKQIDRKKIKKLIRAGDVEDVEVEDETRVVVGSLEDYLMEREKEEEDEMGLSPYEELFGDEYEDSIDDPYCGNCSHVTFRKHNGSPGPHCSFFDIKTRLESGMVCEEYEPQTGGGGN